MARWYQDFFWFALYHTKIKKLWKFHNVEMKFHGDFPDPPYIFMGNHSHAEDPYIIGIPPGDTIHYMANIDGVSNVQRVLSHLVACYGKKKGAPDFAAIKKTIEFLKAGEPVGIFPEGDRSWDGETAPLIPGTTALAVKYKVPIILAVQRGNYLSFPRWADNPRSGRIQVDYHIIDVEEVKNSTVDELEEKVRNLLYVNDVKEPINRDVVYKGKDLASGIQRLLWICPSCGKQDSLTGEGDNILCTSCQSKWLLDGSLKISPIGKQGEDLKDWYDWQKGETEKICENAKEEVLTISSQVVLGQVIDRKMIDPKRGDFKLYKDRAVFTPEKGEELALDVSKIGHYIDNFNNAFEFDYDKIRYRILFEGKNAVKWIDLFNSLKK